MDDNTNYYRDPDEVRCEQLIDDCNYFSNLNINSFQDINYFNSSVQENDNIHMADDTEFKIAIEESLKEYKEMEQLFDEEKKILQQIKPRIQRLATCDKINQIYYEIILNVIGLYENQFITVYSPDEMEYTHICFLLNKIRLKKEEYELLHKIIIFK